LYQKNGQPFLFQKNGAPFLYQKVGQQSKSKRKLKNREKPKIRRKTQN
jgi:hypothetical protein